MTEVRQRAAGWAVHVYTALGSVIGLFALLAAARGNAKEAFLWLGAALAIGLLWATVRYGVTGFLSELLAGESGLISLVGERDLWLITPFLVGGALLLAVVTAWLALHRHVRV